MERVAYTIENELSWISENIYGPKKLEYVQIYEKFLHYNKQLKEHFLQNVIVTLSRHQLEQSYCYRMLAASDNKRLHNACAELKILVAVVGYHSSFVLQCYDLDVNNSLRMAEILPIYERHSPSINNYVNHLENLQRTLGYKLNVIWPNDLNNIHTVDVFLKCCTRNC